MKDFEKIEEELMNKKVIFRKKVGPHWKNIELYMFKGIQYLLELDTFEYVQVNLILDGSTSHLCFVSLLPILLQTL